MFNKFTSFKDFDKILKFENLDQDFKELCDDLDLDHEPLPHLAQSSGEHYSHYYNEETKNIIAEAWSEDVANFGYEYETV